MKNITVTVNKSRFLENFLLFTCFSAYFFPPIRLSSGFEIRLDDIITLGIFPFLFIYKPLLYNNRIFTIFILSLLSIIISTLYGYFYLAVPTNIRDVNEIIRLSKPLLFILLILQADSCYIMKKFEKLMSVFSVLIITIAFIQYFNPAGLGRGIASLYASENHVNALVGHSKRIVITGSDPNIGAAIVMLFWLFNLFSGIIKKNNSKIFITLLLTIVIMMTSSRTSFLALICIIIIFLFMSKGITFTFKLIIVAIIGFIIFMLYKYFQYISVGFELMMSGENTSMLVRFEKWKEAMVLFRQSPFFGWGPGKSSMETIVDGEYVLLLRRYGIIGTFFILLFIFCMPIIKKEKKNNKYMYSKNVLIIDNVLKYYLIGIMFIMITNSFFTSYQLLLPYVFLCMVLYKEKNI